MSDLREAIKDAVRQPVMNDLTPLPSDVDRAADNVMAVFEAYLREHDAQTNERWRAIDAHNTKSRLEVERERIRQRIEALPAPYWPYDAAAASTGWDKAMSAVLEALGGSDDLGS